nr:hypothetical protein [Tanacetum cinerariifolium]
MKHTHTFSATTPATAGHLQPPLPPSENFSGEPQNHSPPPDLLDPPHHSPPRAATACKTTITSTTYNTTMEAAALAVIFAMQPPQHHQKGAFDSYKDATSTIGVFGYVVPEQGAFVIAAAARLRLV